MKRLLVISNMAHYRDPKHGVVGFGPAVEELSWVALLFDEVVHLGCLHEGQAPLNMLPYSAPNLRFFGVPPRGGEGIPAKAAILAQWPFLIRVLMKHLRTADAVHVRCPCNIGLLAVILLCLVREPRRRWIKYAGNWRPEGREPWSYRVQRWLLRRTWHGGVVTVNGQWEGDPPHVREFFNPSFSEAELEEARSWGRKKALNGVVRCAFVGRVEEAKGAGRAVEIVRRLREQGVEAELDVVGDGPMKEALVRANAPWLRLHGWLPRQKVGRVWREAHMCLLPSRASEGWPKVLSEGMAWGAVPVASTVSSIPQYLERFGCGGGGAGGRCGRICGGDRRISAGAGTMEARQRAGD
ncbi:MAG: glycosyl transferase [Bryobacteraceae bacterium]|nr:MAG: glycosyl transferase [Bryobacteraceae bacterium]